MYHTLYDIKSKFNYFTIFILGGLIYDTSELNDLLLSSVSNYKII